MQPSSCFSRAGAASEMQSAIEHLMPLCRSITGAGLRSTLDWLAESTDLQTTEVPSGTRVFDWTIPPEWNVAEARLLGPQGEQVCALDDSPLRIVNYSHAVDKRLSLRELHSHVHSLPSSPDWIPYRTSYYSPAWGFCLRHRELLQLQDGEYRAKIDSTLDPNGSLTFGEVVLPGRSRQEILFTAHCCHPGMANDNLSGLVVAWQLCKWLSTNANRRYTYRFVFAPGTIGAIAWLALNQHRFARIAGGLVLALLGDPQAITYKTSRQGQTRIDAITASVLSEKDSRQLPFSPIGYDERQYGASGIDLPIGRLTRSVEGEYAQYHSSGDDLSCVSAESLTGSLETLQAIVTGFEEDVFYRIKAPVGELQLGKRGLYKPASGAGTARAWVLNSAEHGLATGLSQGEVSRSSRGLREVAGISGIELEVLQGEANELEAAGLIEPLNRAAEEKIHVDASSVIPGGAHTYAKGRDQYPDNAPESIVSGFGCRVTDNLGRTFVEYGSGLRSVSLGHAFPTVTQAAMAQMQLGANFVRPAEIEAAAAADLLSILPAAEMVKFAKNGSDVTTAAVKLSRAYTGRLKVLVCADQPFFSVDDWFISQTPMDAGIPATTGSDVEKFPYGDLQYLEDLFKQRGEEFACLMMEAETYTLPPQGYLRGVQELCRRYGVLFVLDEMITGFRWHIGGAQALFDLTPDLSTFGKALGNGFAVAALAGRREIMELGGLHHNRPRVFLLSTTHGAETHSLAAAQAVIAAYKEYPVIERLTENGRRLADGLACIANDLGISESFYTLGRPSNLIFVTKNPDGQRCQSMRTLLLSQLIQRGVLGPSLVVNFSHDDAAITHTIEAFAESLAVYKDALSAGVEKYFHGPASKPVFRKYN